MSVPPTINVSFPNAIYNTSSSTLGGDVSGPIAANILSSIQGTIINGVSGTSGSAVVLNTNPNITGGTWTNATLVNGNLGASTGTSLTLSGNGTVFIAGGTNAGANNNVFLQNLSATGSVSLLLNIGASGGASGRAGMIYNPTSSLLTVGVLASDAVSSVKILAGGAQSALFTTTGVTLLGNIGLGTSPLAAYGVLIIQFVTAANPVAYANITALTPTANSQICVGEQIAINVQTVTYTGLTLSPYVLVTPTISGSGTITSGYMLTIQAPAAGMTGALSVASGSTSLGGTLTIADATLHRTTVTLTNGAAAQIATLTNGPTAGNPTKWAPVNDNGTTRYSPLW